MTNRQVTLAARPVGEPKETDFAIVEAERPEPRDVEVLVKSLYVSVDPYQRGRMSEARSYAQSLEIGEVITSQTVAEVVESGDRRYVAGDIVVGQFGWQEFALARGSAMRKLPGGVQPTLALHVLGTTGLTAYFGLFDVCEPRPGDTVVVSGAAGGVGQVVGQLAKLAGCRTVGIAGGPEKCRDCVEEHGYDVAIDYKAEDVRAALKQACPDGVDVYFDNVGGEITDAVFVRLAVNSRVAICGAISQYNATEIPVGPRLLPVLIAARARIGGFVVTDYAPRFDEAIPRLARWLAEGTLRYREDVTDGLENAPRAFIGMLRGENRGKALVKV